MTPINIKEEVKELEAKGMYETQVEVIDSFSVNANDPESTDGKHERHKHIFIPALDKHYVKDKDQNWFTGECDICK